MKQIVLCGVWVMFVIGKVPFVLFHLIFRLGVTSNSENRKFKLDYINM